MIIREPHEFDDIFFPGLTNRAIRYYFYCNQGLNILNQFRNLFLGIFALYFALHLENWVFLVAFFVVSAIILTVVGFYTTHHVNKIQEWLGVRFSSHYTMKQFNIQQGIYDELKEINEKLGSRGGERTH